jgi:hypothetical protein
MPPLQATTMPPKKATGTLKKQRMVAPKQKPPTMSDADWAKELARRAAVTADRQNRHIQCQADAELANAASFASYATIQGDSGGEGFFGDSVPAAAERSGTDGGRSCLPRLPPSRISLEFSESQQYPRTFDGGIFSPVTAARQDMVSTSISTYPTPRPHRQTCVVSQTCSSTTPPTPPAPYLTVCP